MHSPCDTLKESMAPLEETEALAQCRELVAGEGPNYIRAAKAPATLRAYRSDWRHFADWCRGEGLCGLPAVPETVARYLSESSASLRPGTLSRRLTSINKVHRAAGYPAPALLDNLVVGETLKGIRRVHGTEQRAKSPLFTDDLRRMVAALPVGLIGLRDRAILLLGFAGAFRRSEVALLETRQMQETKEGLVVRVGRSKTDQEGRGREVAIPYGSDPSTCPVRACRAWIEGAGLREGPLFRRIDRHAHVNARALHKDSIGQIVKRAAQAAGLDPRAYAGHSLRAGFCTQAYMNGAREFDIMRQTGHRSLETLRKYVRGRALFRDNPAMKLGL
jgi:site-specific recombinase XerD